MKKITVGFSRPKKSNILSNFIMWWQGTPFSHVYIRIDSHYGELVYHASKTMVHFIAAKRFDKEHNTVFSKDFLLDNVEYKNVIQSAIDNLGKPYSVGQLAYIFFYEVVEKMGIACWLPAPTINGDNAYICSELVAYLLLRELNDDSLDYITPLDIYDIIKG